MAWVITFGFIAVVVAVFWMAVHANQKLEAKELQEFIRANILYSVSPLTAAESIHQRKNEIGKQYSIFFKIPTEIVNSPKRSQMLIPINENINNYLQEIRQAFRLIYGYKLELGFIQWKIVSEGQVHSDGKIEIEIIGISK